MDEAVKTEVRQYLVFKLGKEEYGVDIQKITTIIEKDMQITRVPKSSPFIKGVINLRGEIIPIMDLRKRFSMPAVEDTEDTRIIILKLEEVTIGIIVDAVAEVVYLTEDAIENISSFSSDTSLNYILGAGKIENRIITIIHLENLIAADEAQ